MLYLYKLCHSLCVAGAFSLYLILLILCKIYYILRYSLLYYLTLYLPLPLSLSLTISTCHLHIIYCYPFIIILQTLLYPLYLLCLFPSHYIFYSMIYVVASIKDNKSEYKMLSIRSTFSSSLKYLFFISLFSSNFSHFICNSQRS